MSDERRVIECVPNFSEGRDMGVIKEIADAIGSCVGVKVLNVDPGEAAHRTVVTFVGEPEAVCEAAFRAVKRAAELIDMRLHHGEHPRIGATDVLPLVPVSGVTLEESAEMARQLARRVAEEAHVPCYCYEAAAFKPERRNLAVCRRGEYEGLAARLACPEEAPDYGARPYDEGIARTGCTVVGARDFLIAVNFNLNTTSVPLAQTIAREVREKGCPKLGIPGGLKTTKAIGWYIEEYGIAQVSMNLTDIHVTPLHVAYDEVKRRAEAKGLQVTGTELIGLIPEHCLVEAGTYFLRKRRQPADLPKAELIQEAIRSMGMDDLRPFRPEEKVIPTTFTE